MQVNGIKVSMGDECDRAFEESSFLESIALQNHRNRQGQGLQPKGACYNCCDPLGAEQIYCDPDCESDHRRIEANRLGKG